MQKGNSRGSVPSPRFYGLDQNIYQLSVQRLQIFSETDLNSEIFPLEFILNSGIRARGWRKMPKTHFNIQDQFLNQVRKARIQVEALLLSGDSLKGYVRSFDSFCIIVENDDEIRLIYKHALSMIRPAEPGAKIPGLV
jgi:host factor-I protein